MVRFFRGRASKPLFALALVEGVFFFAAFYFGIHLSWVEFDAGLSETVSLAPKAAIFTVVLLSMMFAVGLYHTRFLSRYIDMMVRVAVSLALGAVILTAIFYLFPQMQIWRSTMVPAFFASFAVTAITRYGVLRLVGADFLQRRVAVIGVGERAARIDGLDREGKAFGFTCVGYFDLGTENIEVPRSRIVGPVAELERTLREERIDEIVVAADMVRSPLPVHTLIEYKMRGISVHRYADFYERETGSMDLEALDSSDVALSGGLRSSRLRDGLKRTMDVSVSLIFLVLFLPVLIFTAAAIRLESRGPVILQQERVGFRGRVFVVLKFRSMRVDSEGDGVPRWAAANDSRITRVGAIIRKFRIDELPQLVNVLRGEMSFVGPRPERPYFVEQLAEQIPFYGERHQVKPGITGWAQLNYQYGASIEDARRKLQFDLYYLFHHSLLLDVVIILQTVRVILWPQGVR